MEKLVKGILEFRQNILPTYRKDFAHLALGQSPDTLFIACSDSRVVPNLFASTNPGDLFVIRNMGNLIPPFTEVPEEGTAESAAIEFSLANLPISEIVVCGHSECGAMHAILSEDNVKDPHLKGWLKHCDCLLDQKDLVGCETLSAHNRLSQINVLQQIKHLKTYPPIIERMKKGTLNIHGWYFDIATGDVYAYEEQFHQFVLIDEIEAPRILSRLKKRSFLS
jgi:carbonic anhydrase